MTDYPPIPDRRYFTISETADLCGVEAHVLRYWEKEFPGLSPAKRRGGRRFYMVADVLIIREIRDLLYDRGFTIRGAKAEIENRRKLAKEKREVPPSPEAIATISLEGIIEELKALAGQLESL